MFVGQESEEDLGKEVGIGRYDGRGRFKKCSASITVFAS